jgi:hypothetical protein
MGPVLKSMMKPMFDKGLKDLKTYIETGKKVHANPNLQNKKVIS